VIRDRQKTEEDIPLDSPARPKAAGTPFLAAVGVFFAFLVMLALLPDSLGQVAGVVRSELDIPAMVNFGTGLSQPVPVPPVGQNPGAAVPVVMPGLSPFSPTKPQPFSGRVSQTVSLGADVGWGQMHIWVNDGSGNLREVSLAPLWYLQQVGCANFENARVYGTGYQFDPSRPNAELYAKSITVNGKTCLLRDDEGLALWGNPTR
jgi:hypothetical protein